MVVIGYRLYQTIISKKMAYKITNIFFLKLIKYLYEHNCYNAELWKWKTIELLLLYLCLYYKFQLKQNGKRLKDID